MLIAGAGVAAVEAVLALRQLVGRQSDIELLAPRHVLVNKPASVATPFGLGAPPPLDLHELAARYGVTLVEGELAGVDAGSRTAHVGGGDDRTYDHLLVSVGARPVPAVPGALTFRGPADVAKVEAALDKAARVPRVRLAIVIPPGNTWPLPAYELAVMASTELRMRGAERIEITLVTPEREPLWLFGPAAGKAMRELLAARGIALRTDAHASRVEDCVLWFEGGDSLPVDTVLSLPVLEGPRVAGLPADDDGFIPTDAHGLVSRAEHVFAAGDATTFPVKQGGLATQQADAAAAAIATELGAAVQARPFVPVLRGLLLTGGAPLYLRAELDRSGAPRSAIARPRPLRGEVSSRALWWPPGKIAGRYLAPYRATARPVALGNEPLFDRSAGAAGSNPEEHEAAFELALLLADDDAAMGDLTQALHALDAAAVLGGGVLPTKQAERRERWRAQLAPAKTHR